MACVKYNGMQKPAKSAVFDGNSVGINSYGRAHIIDAQAPHPLTLRPANRFIHSTVELCSVSKYCGDRLWIKGGCMIPS